jgi:hypothetical protein
MVDGTTVNLGLWDTAGQEDYESVLRTFSETPPIFLTPAPVLMSFMFADVADCVPFLTPRPTSSWSASRSSVQRALRTSRPSGCPSESPSFSQQRTSTCRGFRQADTTIRFSCRIAHHCPQTPKILVGTKLDMRKDPQTLDKMRERKQQPIEYSQVRLAFEVR